MTIYQAKGLEFPVVVVGRLNKMPGNKREARKDLQKYYYHAQFEPESRIVGCDRRHLYYVAFSRPKSLLVLSTPRQPHANFTSIWNRIPALSTLHASLPIKNEGDVPLRLSLYWTAEAQLTEALVEIPYCPDEIRRVEKTLHQAITRIQQRQFAVEAPPDPAICRVCDIRYLCRKEGIIQV